MTSHAARQVTYERDGDQVEVPATTGETTFEQDDGQGALIRVQVRDYLIDTSRLVLGGSVALPKPGDRVRETENGKTFIYEVMSMAGEPCWRYSDPFRLKLRIHTKHVGTEDA